MSRLFYTDTTAEVGADSLGPFFALERFIPELGVVLSHPRRTISSYLVASSRSAAAYAALAERLAVAVRAATLRHGHTVTLSMYSSKHDGADGSLGVRPLVVLSTTIRGGATPGAVAGADTALAALIAAGQDTLRPALAAARGDLTLLARADEIYAAARAAVMPRRDASEDETVLLTCLGGAGLRPYQKCLLLADHVGNIFDRRSLPGLTDHDLSESIFAGLVGEALPPGLGCRVDVYETSTAATDPHDPASPIEASVEDDGLTEAIAGRYIHYEDSAVVAGRFGTFMESLAIRTLELSAMRSLAAVSPSIWAPTLEHHGVALASSFPGTLTLVGGDHPRPYSLLLAAR
jgi:hypothetical protein